MYKVKTKLLLIVWYFYSGLQNKMEKINRPEIQLIFIYFVAVKF